MSEWLSIIFRNFDKVFYLHVPNIYSKSKLHANQIRRFQVQVDFPSPYSPNKRTRPVLEIAYMILQKKIYDDQGKRILPIEDVQRYESNFAIHPM